MIKLTLIFLLTLAGLQTWAGVGSSGGGQSVVCRGNQGEIQSAELFDLWEGKNLYQLNIHGFGLGFDDNLSSPT